MALSRARLDSLLDALVNARVVVCGDFALDVHWELADDDGELSIETGLPVSKVRAQRFTPGGAGNVAENARALGAQVHAIGLIGDDPYGRALLRCLEDGGIDVAGLLQRSDWDTHAFIKPVRGNDEQSRFDFGAHNTMHDALAQAVSAQLARVQNDASAIVFNQQIPRGLWIDEYVAAANASIASVDCPCIVDARDSAARFEGAAMKLNIAEGRRLLGRPEASPAQLASELHVVEGLPTFVTAGDDGIWFADSEDAGHVAAPTVPPPIDPCGGGDTVIATLAAALGTGATAREACELAALAGAVVVRKLATTGTATPEEIRAEHSA